MPGERIQIISPRTWGELGNFLAASRFAGVVRQQLPEAEVTLVEVEPLLPWVGEIGAQIRAITLGNHDSATRTRRYLELMARLSTQWPQGFEAEEPRSGVRGALSGLVRHLRETRPDIVVGTQGFITRLCLAASRATGARRPRVADHVTNPGLLRLAVHRSPHPDLTFVGFDWARTMLITCEGHPPDRIQMVGPLVTRHHLASGPNGGNGGNSRQTTVSGGCATQPWGGTDSPQRPKVIMFCHRGGEAYLRVIDHLAHRDADIDLVFVGQGDPETTRRAEDLARRGNGLRWRFHARLRQEEYATYIERAAQTPHSFLISTAGPTTTLEAAYVGIPLLVLDSGLPMESWVPGLIHERGLGRCCRTATELLDVLSTWLDRPELVAEHRRNAAAYAAAGLDQDSVAHRIGHGLRGLLRHC